MATRGRAAGAADKTWAAPSAVSEVGAPPGTRSRRWRWSHIPDRLAALLPTVHHGGRPAAAASVVRPSLTRPGAGSPRDAAISATAQRVEPVRACGRDRCAAGGPATPGWAARTTTVLAGSDELPRQQPSEPVAALDRPAPGRPCGGPAEQRPASSPERRTTWSSPSCSPVLVDRDGGVGALVTQRIDADGDRTLPPVPRACRTRRGTSLNSGMTRPLSSYAVCGHGRRRRL